MKYYFTILFICLLFVAGSSQKEKNYECSNQENPLLDADGLFTCSKIKACPRGFFCERRDEANDTGFCCPDMEQLNKLYGEDENSEVPERNRQESSIEAATDNESTDADYILDAVFGTKFSCKKQKYELKCRNGTLKTQSTIRWYFNGEECDFYPWGYCPGDLVVESSTLLTKRACEELCIFGTNASSLYPTKDAFSSEESLTKVDVHDPLNDTPGSAVTSATTVPNYALEDLLLNQPSSRTINDADSNKAELGQPTDTDNSTDGVDSSNTYFPSKTLPENHTGLENRVNEDGKQLYSNSAHSTVSEDDLTKAIAEEPIGQNLTKASGYDLILFPGPDSKLENEELNTRDAKEKSKQLEKFEMSKMRCVASPNEECSAVNVNGMDPMTDIANVQIAEMAQNGHKGQVQNGQNVQKDNDIVEVDDKLTNKITTITYVEPGGSAPNDVLQEGDYSMEEPATEDEDYNSVVADKKGITIEEPAKEYQPLMCLRLPYRELCDNGLGAQYTVRWVVIDDLCQSIPFGYCNGEKNMLLPLTEADCRIRCLHESVDDVHFGSSQPRERYIDKQFLSRLHHHFINRLI